MKKIVTQIFLSLFLLGPWTVALAQGSIQIDTLPVLQDNSLYSENDNSNGAGVYLFAGRTNQGNLRRALIQFDLSAIPEGATITDVMLEITGSRQGPNTVSAYRVTSPWGEGTSVASGNQGKGAMPTNNDATWNFTFFDDQSWNTPGGDFVSTLSADTQVSNLDRAVWGSPDMISDVQAWVDGTAENYGWILIGQEDQNGSAVRMNARENSNDPPALIVGYQMVNSTPLLTEQQLRMDLQPNPVSDRLVLTYTFTDRPESLTGYLYNWQGQQIARYALTPVERDSIDLPVDQLPPGLYSLTLRTDQGLRTVRFVKQ